jgi:soluble lytic murein transglycosylase
MARWLNSIIISCVLIGAPILAQDEDVKADGLMSAISSKKWQQADEISQQLKTPSAQMLTTWARLRDGGAGWVEYRDFLTSNPHWPGLKKMRKQAEGVLAGVATNREIRTLFTDYTPQTAAGALALGKVAPDTIVSAWKDLNFTQSEQSDFLGRFSKQLAPHHNARLENLLWRGALKQAKAMLPLVSDENRAMAQIRIDLQEKTLPNETQNLTGGLAYNYFQHLIKQGEWDAAQAVIVSITGAENKMDRPKEWAKRRRGFARRAMRAGEIQTAYDLARFHGLSEGADYADLEWLAGYISLHHLGQPDQALAHFQKFEKAVKSPISRGRAGYWLGQTFEALAQYEQAAKSYRNASEHQTSFYGQLSAQRNRSKPDPLLKGRTDVDGWQEAPFANDTVFNAAQLLHAANRPHMTRWFLSHMAETMPLDQVEILAKYTDEIGADFSTVSIAKEAVKRGTVISAAYFPVTDLADFAQSVPAELAMSIARRESELNPTAVSPAGARGLMQIMPATARDVAAEIEIDYDKAKLTEDWEYNATLGTAYLGGLIDRFDGSYVLAIAAYNAGPHRVEEWIESNGDPRKTDTDAIHWIEHIPYRETRNYVMRVIESLHVYRARIAGKTLPLRVYQDLSR